MILINTNICFAIIHFVITRCYQMDGFENEIFLLTDISRGVLEPSTTKQDHTDLERYSAKIGTHSVAIRDKTINMSDFGSTFEKTSLRTLYMRKFIAFKAQKKEIKDIQKILDANDTNDMIIKVDTIKKLPSSITINLID